MEKGGRTKRIAEELAGLANLGHTVQLVCFSPPPEWVLNQYAGSEKWAILPKRGGKFDFALLAKLRGLAKEFKPDIIHAHCEASALYAGIASKLVRVKCVATVHRSETKYYRAGFKHNLYYRFADAFVAVSHERKTQMFSKLGIQKKPIQVVHWGIDLDARGANDGTQAARAELGLGDQGGLGDKDGLGEQAILLSIGHLGEIKGHDESITALATIREQGWDVRLYIAGDGAESDYQRLQGLIKSLALENAVTLLGQISNVTQWLNACDIFLLPSREEAFGLVFLEAGLCKKPCVATRVGGIPEIVLDGQTGLLVETQNPQQIQEAVRSLLESSQTMTAMGDAAYERVRSEFCLPRKVEELAQYFAEVSDHP
ncbi:MAG: glycosyltransferase family 4 protein [Congregibacter sp.]